MPLNQILALLKNSGFTILNANEDVILLQDPTCFMASLAGFLDFAWIIIQLVTVLLLIGWGLSAVRGAKINIMTNLRNLTIIFGVLSISRPIYLFFIEPGQSFACKTISVSVAEIRRVVDADHSLDQYNDPFESYDIYDTGATHSDYFQLMQAASEANLDKPDVKLDKLGN